MIFIFFIDIVVGFDINYQKNIEEINRNLIDDVQINENSTTIPPPTIIGPRYGKPGNVIIFTVNIKNLPSLEYYYLMIDWGDGTSSKWFGPLNFSIVSVSHVFNFSGDYFVRAKIKDKNNIVSKWSNEIVISIEDEKPKIKIVFPKNQFPFFFTVIIGRCDIKVNAFDNESGMDRVEFFIDNNRRYVDYDEPFSWLWDELVKLRLYTIKVIGYDNAGNKGCDCVKILKFL